MTARESDYIESIFKTSSNRAIISAHERGARMQKKKEPYKLKFDIKPIDMSKAEENMSPKEKEFWEKRKNVNTWTTDDEKELSRIRQNVRQEKWKKENQDYINLKLPKGYKDRISEYCSQNGTNITAFIRTLIDEKIPQA